MENKHFKVNEQVYIFDNRCDEPRIIEGTIAGAVKRDGIYDFIYWVDSPCCERCLRLPYQIYKSLEELKEGILDYVIQPNISK